MYGWSATVAFGAVTVSLLQGWTVRVAVDGRGRPADVRHDRAAAHRVGSGPAPDGLGSTGASGVGAGSPRTISGVATQLSGAARPRDPSTLGHPMPARVGVRLRQIHHVAPSVARWVDPRAGDEPSGLASSASSQTHPRLRHPQRSPGARVGVLPSARSIHAPPPPQIARSWVAPDDPSGWRRSHPASQARPPARPAPRSATPSDRPGCGRPDDLWGWRRSHPASQARPPARPSTLRHPQRSPRLGSACHPPATRPRSATPRDRAGASASATAHRLPDLASPGLCDSFHEQPTPHPRPAGRRPRCRRRTPRSFGAPRSRRSSWAWLWWSSSAAVRLPGFFGAGLGLVIVLAFFSISWYVVSTASAKGPAIMMGAAFGDVHRQSRPARHAAGLVPRDRRLRLQGVRLDDLGRGDLLDRLPGACVPASAGALRRPRHPRPRLEGRSECLLWSAERGAR